MWYETRDSQPNPNPNFMDNGIRTRWIVGYKGSPDNRAFNAFRIVKPMTPHELRRITLGSTPRFADPKAGSALV